MGKFMECECDQQCNYSGNNIRDGIIQHGLNIIAKRSKDNLRYNRRMLPDLEMDDILRLRKAHPCGGYTWRVSRLGADIGLECLTCGRRVMLTRRELRNRLKKNLGKGTNNDST